MEKDIEQAYQVYLDMVEQGLSKNEFYQYFYNVIDAGSKYYKFSNKRKYKYVDSTWVDEIEKALDSLEEVVRKPRSFIEEDRQVVNVNLARNVTNETINYLCIHGNMVDTIKEDGTVIPNRVLAIYKEESLNTYENRFIASLIILLSTFLEKRVTIISENTKDEYGGKLDIETTIDNYTEVVHYKLHVKIEQKQETMDNDRQNEDIFARIDSINERVTALANSNFLTNMKQFPAIKPPVVKTNLIANNPAYLCCYNLWNFLQTYDRVGYQVRVLEQKPVISRQFEENINRDILMNYLILKNYMEDSDVTNINRPKKEKDSNSHSLSQLINDIITCYGDRSDVEIKRIVMKELSNALLSRRSLIRKAEWARKKTV